MKDCQPSDFGVVRLKLRPTSRILADLSIGRRGLWTRSIIYRNIALVERSLGRGDRGTLTSQALLQTATIVAGWQLSEQSGFNGGRLAVPSVVPLGVSERVVDHRGVGLRVIVQQLHDLRYFIFPVVCARQEAVFAILDYPRKVRSRRCDRYSADNCGFEIFEFRFTVGENIAL